MLKNFADDLRTIREEKNISLRTISQQTRLNIVILENIESGDFTFQPQAYIRAFLKQYAASLGLDVDETLFDYDLARSGKYTPKYAAQRKTTETKTEDDSHSPEKKNKPEEKKNADKHSKKEAEVKQTEDIKKSKEKETPDTAAKETELKKTGTRTLEKSDKTSGEAYYNKPNKNIIVKLMSLPVVRNIGLIIFFILILLAIYSLINIVFLEGSKDGPEIIRQNFDEVVKEQEKKILGKRTPEEIQDSIRRAEEQLASLGDSITLKVTAITDGTIFLVTDSASYNRPDKINYEKGETGVFKAKRIFHLSSTNTNSFRATVNDIQINFDKTNVSKVPITKNGIVK